MRGGGAVVLGGIVYVHDDLVAISGSWTTCRPVPLGEDGAVGAQVELLDGTPVCVAEPLRHAGRPLPAAA